MALSFRLEIVIFSPARRASRKLLERVVEFVRLLGCEDRIVEFNQEQCRVNAYDGNSSLIRSFPSKVGVSGAHSNPRPPHFASPHIHKHGPREKKMSKPKPWTVHSWPHLPWQD